MSSTDNPGGGPGRGRKVETTTFDFGEKRSFRIVKADGTIQEFLSSAHADEHGNDVAKARRALGWVDGEGNPTPLSTSRPHAERPWVVQNSRTGSHVSSHTSKNAAESAASKLNDDAHDALPDLDHDPYVATEAPIDPEVV